MKPNNKDQPSGSASLEEYTKIRDRLFETTMKLIETEAQLKNREAELRAIGADVDPELLAERRIRDALRKDPEIASLRQEIDQLRSKVAMADFQKANQSDPSLVQSSPQLEAKNQDLRDLIAGKKEELVSQGAGEDPALHELHAQVDSLKARKCSFEKLVRELRVTNQKDVSVAAKMALAEDLSSLREMRGAVEKRIQQLEFESRGAARIQQIEQAKPSGTPVRDGRQRLWAVTPFVVLAMVLSLFLVVEI